MNWAEPLPDNCPPENAAPPNQEHFYRLIESSEPTEIDFYSHRMRWPNKTFNTSECVARAISIFNEIKACEKARKFPTKRDKKIVEIFLPQESGLIKQNGKEISHHSWWRRNDFNPFDYCSVIDA